MKVGSYRLKTPPPQTVDPPILPPPTLCCPYPNVAPHQPGATSPHLLPLPWLADEQPVAKNTKIYTNCRNFFQAFLKNFVVF